MSVRAGLVRFDRTLYSVVLVCQCGWRDVLLTHEAAHRAAVIHERNVHPGASWAREAAGRYTERSH